MSIQNNRALLDMIDNVKEKLTSQEYKDIVDNIVITENDKTYVVSIMYIKYQYNIEEHEYVEFTNYIDEYLVKFNRSELKNPSIFDKYLLDFAMNKYSSFSTELLVDCIPDMYRHQIIDILVPEKNRIYEDNEDKCCGAYKTISVKVKVTCV